MNSDEPGVQVIPNDNSFTDRNGVQARYIILHGTAGGTSAVAIANYFASTQNGTNPVSSHYVIGVDGEVVQCVAEKDGAWGNGAFSAGYDGFWNNYPGINPNNLTISIEHCKPDTNNATPLTAAQRSASYRLIKDICTRQNIPMRFADANGGITGHFSLDPISRANCPGVYDWSGLWSYLKAASSSNTPQPEKETEIVIELTSPGVSQFFYASSDGYWGCNKTRVRIGGAFLSFYKRFGNDTLCGITHLGLPLLQDFAFIKAHPEVRMLVCERGVLIYDPSHVYDSPPGAGAVYLAHIDSGAAQTIIAKPLMSALNTEIANLKSQIATLNNALQTASANSNTQAEIATLKKELSAAYTTLHQFYSLAQSYEGKAA